MNYLYFFLAFVAGMGLSIQAAVNSRLGAGFGGQPLMAALISFAVGTMALLIVAIFIADWRTVAVQASSQSTWRWMGGLIGAIVVFTSVFLAPKIGVTNTMFLFIIGQLLMGMLIDGMGLVEMPVRPIYWWKYVGLVIMLIGLGLFMFGENWLKRSNG